jgi:hypothetical protein
MRRWMAGSLVFALLGACGDDGPKVDPLAKASGFCEAWAEKACNPDVVDNCSEQADEEACLESQKDFCLSIVPASDYRKDGVSECLAAVQAAYDDVKITAEEAQIVLMAGPPCHRVRGEGEPSCKNDDECEDFDGASCEKLDGASVGTCVVDGGRSCSGDGLDCADGFYCNEKNCVARLGEGEECASDEQCTPELRCTFATEDAEVETCAPRKAVDEECKAHSDCASRFCASSRCATRAILSDKEDICEDLS